MEKKGEQTVRINQNRRVNSARSKNGTGRKGFLYWLIEGRHRCLCRVLQILHRLRPRAVAMADPRHT